MIMRAQTLIKHAHTQGGGVSMVKITDPAPTVPMVLIMDAGCDTVARVVPSLVKGELCGWCDDTPATRTATDSRGWVDHMCSHHAYVWGRFVPAS